MAFRFWADDNGGGAGRAWPKGWAGSIAVPTVVLVSDPYSSKDPGAPRAHIGIYGKPVVVLADTVIAQDVRVAKASIAFRAAMSFEASDVNIIS
jgi:hypothetical protein